MKGQIPIFEAISAAIILLIALSVFFPGFFYESKWSEAFIILKSRDIIITIDRLLFF
jgi:hypothetical protein